MAKVRVPFKIKYIDYRVCDARVGDPWKVIVAFGSREEAEKAAKLLTKKLRRRITVFRDMVIIEGYVLEYTILSVLAER